MGVKVTVAPVVTRPPTFTRKRANFTPPGAESFPESGRETAKTFPSEPRNWVSVVETLPNPLLGRKFDLEAIAGPDMFPPFGEKHLKSQISNAFLLYTNEASLCTIL